MAGLEVPGHPARSLFLAAGFAIAALVFDLSTPLGVAAGVPYVAVVLAVLWTPNRRLAYYAAFLGTGLTLFGYFASPAGGLFWVVITNRVLTVFAIWITVLLGGRIHENARRRALDNQRCQVVIEHASDAILAIDTSGRLVDANPAAAAMFGYDPHEFRRLTLADLLLPQHEAARLLRAAREDEGGIDLIDARGIRKDESEIRVEISVKRLPDGNTLCVVRDVTARRKASEELHRLHRAVEQSTAKFLIMDADGVVEYVNRAFERPNVSDGKRAPPNATGAAAAPHGLVFSEYETALDDLDKGKTWRTELERQEPDGEVCWEQVSISAVRGSDGEITHYVAIKEDVTALKLMEKELREALTEKDTLLRELHHRVKNNLQIVMSLLNLRSRNARLACLRCDTLVDAMNSVNAILRVHEGVRPSSGFDGRVEVGKYLGHLMEGLRETHQSSRKIVLMKFEPDRCYLKSRKAGACGLILSELVSNAFRHAFPDGTAGNIQVTCRLGPADRLSITVADDGVGMSRSSEPESASTVGWPLVTSLAEQIGGELVLGRWGTVGTQIELIVPVDCEQTE